MSSRPTGSHAVRLSAARDGNGIRRSQRCPLSLDPPVDWGGAHPHHHLRAAPDAAPTPRLALGKRAAPTVRHRHHQGPYPRGGLTIQPSRARQRNHRGKAGQTGRSRPRRYRNVSTILKNCGKKGSRIQMVDPG